MAMPPCFWFSLEDARDEGEIVAEALGQACQSCLLHVSMQHLPLHRHEHCFVRIALRQGSIVEREEERVDEKDPAEALGIEVRRHGNAVGGRRLDAQLVEDVVEVSLALRLSQRLRL